MAVKTSTRARPTSCDNAVRSCIEKFGTFAVLDSMIAEFKWMETFRSLDFFVTGDGEPHLELICVAAKSMAKNLESVRDEWSSLAVTLETLNAKEMK